MRGEAQASGTRNWGEVIAISFCPSICQSRARSKESQMEGKRTGKPIPISLLSTLQSPALQPPVLTPLDPQQRMGWQQQKSAQLRKRRAQEEP